MKNKIHSVDDFRPHQATVENILSTLSMLGWEIEDYGPDEFYARRTYSEEGNDYVVWGTVQGDPLVGLAYFTSSGGDFFDVSFSLTDWRENVAKIIHHEYDYRINIMDQAIQNSYDSNLALFKSMPNILEWVLESQGKL